MQSETLYSIPALYVAISIFKTKGTGSTSINAMVEIPVLLTSIRLLYTFYSACTELYDGFKLTQTFGRDFKSAKNMLDVQYARLYMTGQIYLHTLEDPIDPEDQFHPATKAVIGLLGEIKLVFEKCDALIKEYNRKGIIWSQLTSNTTLVLTFLIEGESKHKKLQKKRPTLQITDDYGSNDQMEHTASQRLASNIVTRTASPSIADSSHPENSTATITHSTSISHLSVKTLSRNAAPKTLQGKGDGKNKDTKERPEGGVLRSALQRFHLKKGSKREQDNDRASSGTASNDLPHSDIAAAAGEVLYREELEAAAQNSAKEEKWLQKDSDLLERVQWVKEDREALFGYAEKLRTYLTDLENLLRLKSTCGTTVLSQTSKDHKKSLTTVAKQTQVALHRLHESLRMMNKRNDPWVFSLQLAEDFEKTGSDFVHLNDYLPLRKGESLYFTLQRQSSKSAGDSELFVAETLATPPDAKSAIPHSVPLAIDLNKASVHIGCPKADSFTEWGVVRVDSHLGDLHWLFKDNNNEWQSYETLADTLSRPETGQKMSPNKRINLALLITWSYLYLGTIRPSCDSINLDSFRYFVRANEDTSWDDEDPLILYPYLSFGFGQRPVDVVVGGKRKASKDPGTVIHELGINLVQIGCCQVHSNTKAPMLSTARSWALTNLHELECCVTVPYAEVARDCPQYSASSISAQKAREENEFLADIVLRLSEVKKRLFGTLAGDAVPLQEQPLQLPSGDWANVTALRADISVGYLPLKRPVASEDRKGPRNKIKLFLPKKTHQPVTGPKSPAKITRAQPIYSGFM